MDGGLISGESVAYSLQNDDFGESLHYAVHNTNTYFLTIKPASSGECEQRLELAATNHLSTKNVINGLLAAGTCA